MITIDDTMAEKSLGLATRRVLADVVTDDLREAIVTHELEPGSRLTEDDLAAQLGVSRGPVREALLRLEREGLIHIERHRGARVASWSRNDIEEIYSLRGELEKLALEWACKNATEEDFDRVEAILEEYENLPSNSRTPREIAKLDLAFHTGLFSAAHHERLYRSWEVLCSQFHAFLVYTWSQDEKVNKALMPNWGPDHRKILNLVKAKDVNGAKKEMTGHVLRGYERVSKHFPDTHSKKTSKKSAAKNQTKSVKKTKR